MDSLYPTLVQAALAGLDPSWLPELAPELVCQARQQSLGRGLLADRLADRLAEDQALFRDLSVFSNELQPPQLPEWLFRPLPNCVSLTLGAHAHGALIKTAVARSQVARLRELLGASLYTQVLNAPSPGEVATGIELLLKAEDIGLAERFHRQGAVELYHLALGIHPLAAERIQWVFHQSWQLASGHPRLSAGQAVRWLEAGMETHTTESTVTA